MQAFRFVVVAMLLLLQKPIKVAAAESSDNCETLAIYNHPKRCKWAEIIIFKTYCSYLTEYSSEIISLNEMPN